MTIRPFPSAGRPVSYGLCVLEVQDVRSTRRLAGCGAPSGRSCCPARSTTCLHALIAAPGDIVSRDELMRDVWGASFWTSSKTIDVHLGWVRRKLGDDSRRPIADQHGPRPRVCASRPAHPSRSEPLTAGAAAGSAGRADACRGRRNDGERAGRCSQVKRDSPATRRTQHPADDEVDRHERIALDAALVRPTSVWYDESAELARLSPITKISALGHRPGRPAAARHRAVAPGAALAGIALFLERVAVDLDPAWRCRSSGSCRRRRR